MATNPVPSEHERREALLRQAAREIRELNPHIDDDEITWADDEYAQLLADDAEVARIWDEFARNGGRITKTISEIVSEDRGE